ncbi:DUF3078 domain-containing protein [Sediminitomix flava]|uniref:DUF3078 family protein n=1 Tax=Sediminitomix flava TaxID=379075 RepID=A0A315ZFP3_SEDFL|nr:DUF3078 domain-containing protein [Sediminitomix flava]PWJ43960.1 Protein of unknown function (DUF3078) [Sediminitomix flava]
MKKGFLFLVAYILVCFNFNLYAQTTELKTTEDSLWTYAGNISANFSQVGLSNWAAGGENTITLNTLFRHDMTRESKVDIWRNSVIVNYGILRKDDTAYKFRKTDDILQWKTSYGYKMSKRWSLNLASDFRTQFSPGYTYGLDTESNVETRQKISDFLSPGYLIFKLSANYSNKAKTLLLSASPISERLTVVRSQMLSDQGVFGVEAGEHMRSQVGFNLNMIYDEEVFKGINFRTVFDLFGAYNDLRHQVVNWETLTTFKINSFLNANISTFLIYDHDVLIPQEEGEAKPATQFKYSFNLGFAYNFNSRG